VNMEDVDWVAGKLNNCLLFDGVNEYVDCGDIANFERTDLFSIECWIKTSIGTTQVICSRVNYTTDQGWQLITNNNKIRVYLMGSVTNRIIVETNTAINDGSWHHVIVTYDGSSLSNGVTIYLDNNTNNTIIQNNLSLTILNTGSCQITGGSGALYPIGVKGSERSRILTTKHFISVKSRGNVSLAMSRCAKNVSTPLTLKP
ncbi:hypothetical protein LCGC14_1915410, partial [marine sediment metagenome]